ncbi:Phage integrase family site specific recombinase [Pseudomonas amygdali pv. morsprunorum]|uniref:Phage integrase family site specific recombinase n=1 Tax=Pseudomonas amygdali pv. morsprunorum TaxID=129138 RepID=A0A3M2X397_PSEA0|nr:Phage integrase family site specific recombinase [Pseudomonas amygdali pv. morsprunorum]
MAPPLVPVSRRTGFTPLLCSGHAWKASRLGVHGLQATAATNALEHYADIAKVHMWLGHANINTTRLYDRRGQRPRDSPTFKVKH